MLGVVLKRDSSVILFGAWMGTKFTDNSRYLFQYLASSNEDNKYKVIWATRSPKVYQQLLSMGYETCLCGSPKALYWHLKAGFHVICNSTVQVGNTLPDIDTKFSWGANKIQLWHGVGFKAVGMASNSMKGKNTLRKMPLLFSEGGWNNCIVLCTSEYDVWINKTCMDRDDNNFIVSCYPRNCKCIRYTDEEKRILEKVHTYKTSVLYLPTFRSEYKNYIHPLMDPKFVRYLTKNNILWIEKPHSASNFDYGRLELTENICLLEPEFDINILYDEASLLISDYSSSVLDGIYKRMPTIMYIPDVEEFKNADVGFLMDIESYFKEIIAYELTECADLIENVINNTFLTESRNKLYDKAINEFYDSIPSSYARVWNDILTFVSAKKGVRTK